MRRATPKRFGDALKHLHFYPRSPCGERHSGYPHTRRHDAISIHALLAESDTHKRAQQPKQPNFYPRSPCGERPNFGVASDTGVPFLSTLSLRRATICLSNHLVKPTFLSTLSLRRATLIDRFASDMSEISIHALLAESDKISPHSAPDKGNFYPRSPCGERLELRKLLYPGSTNFYPRSPCGERQTSSR